MSTWQIDELGSIGCRWRDRSRPARLAVVFVHGFQGDELATWTYKPKRWRRWFRRKDPVSVFDLLMRDDRLLEDRESLPCDLYSLRHRGGIGSPADIDDAANGLRTLIDSYIVDLPVVLVAHSFGGLACRRTVLDALEYSPQEFRILGLLMFGTPNNGTEIARAAKALGSGAGADMEPFNDALARLNREWAEHVVNGGDPDVAPHERAPVLCRFVVGSQDKVVPPNSAATLASFAELKELPCGHLALVKARDRNDPVYVLIADFLYRAEEASRRGAGERALLELTYRLRQATLAGRWVRQEEERVQLDLIPGDPHWLQCQVRNRRQGGLAQRRFHVCVYLSGQRPERKIDFNWEVGRGNMSEQEYGALTHQLQVDPTQFFSVQRLFVRQGEAEETYAALDPIVEPGWVLMPFEAEKIHEGRPYDLLELEFTTRVDRRQGWYFYYLPRTVGERLEVTFVAPFKAQPILGLGSGSELEEPVRSGNHFVHRISAARPLPVGRTVIWVYPEARPEVSAPPQRDEGPPGAATITRGDGDGES